MTSVSVKWLTDHYIEKHCKSLRPSTARFEDGSEFALEIPCINNFQILKSTVDALQESSVYATKFCETVGSFLLSDQEITDMIELCKQSSYGMAFSLSPRPEYDIKASFYRSEFGLEQARQVNNHEAFSYAIDDAYRLIDLGCRCIIVYDIGIMRCLYQLKLSDDLPKNLMLKASSHCMVSNPIIAKIYHENGATNVTTTHDCGIEVLNAMRLLNPELILDVPIDVYKSKGGYNRFHELPDLITYCAPITLKLGASLLGHPYDPNSLEIAPARVDRIKVALEWVGKGAAEYRGIETGEQMCIPV